MLLTFALTVVFDLTVAVYTGVILASLLFMRRMGELTGLHTCVSSEDEASGHEIPVPDKNNVPTVWRFLPSTGRCSSVWLTDSSPR